jgi:hypothetical protein
MIQLGLWFRRKLYGKYSFDFQHHINKLDSRLRLKKNYLNACSKLDPLNHYRKVAEAKAGLQTFQAIHPIVFNEVDFRLSFKKVLSKIGKCSCYDCQKYNDLIWRRYGIKERIYNHGVTRIYHFIDKKFFFGELFFSDLRKIDPAVIAKSLILKYAGANIETVPTNFRINGTDAFIYFENTGINLSIKYISTADQTINEKLVEILRPVSFPDYTAVDLSDEL